jgi:hypothetical protein
MNKCCQVLSGALVVMSLSSVIAYVQVCREERVTRPADIPQQAEPDMNWASLILVQPLTAADVNKYVYDDEWQAFRISLLGMGMPARYLALERWLHEHQLSYASKVQVTNYVNALRRGGLIK